jgi:hypothetical protein
MEEHLEGVAFPPIAVGAAERQMLRADLVREMVARRERGEKHATHRTGVGGGAEDGTALAADQRLATAARRRAASRNRSV